MASPNADSGRVIERLRTWLGIKIAEFGLKVHGATKDDEGKWHAPPNGRSETETP